MGLILLFCWALVGVVAVGTLVLIRQVRRPERPTYAVALGKGWVTEPDGLGLASREVTFRFADGTQTPGWVIEGKRTDGPMVVVTHGWSGSRYSTLKRVPGLAAWASRVVVYDQRGHGESSAKKSHLGPAETEDLLAVIDQVTWSADAASGQRDRRPPATRLVLYGSSMGAGVTLAAAGRLEKEKDAAGTVTLAGVIVEAPYHRLAVPLAARLRLRGLPVGLFLPLIMAHLRFWVPGFGAFDDTPHAAGVSCPVLVLHGTDDIIVPLEEGRLIADAAPNARFVAIEGGAHGGMFQTHEAEFRQAIARFFTETLQAPPPAADDESGEKKPAARADTQ